MMVTQAGTGSGTSGPGGPQDLGVALRRPRHGRSTPSDAAIPGVVAARRRCRRSCRDGSILPPAAARMHRGARPPLDRARLRDARPRLGADARRARAWCVLGTLLVWSATSHRDDLTGGDPTAYLQASSWSTSPSGWC